MQSFLPVVFLVFLSPWLPVPGEGFFRGPRRWLARKQPSREDYSRHVRRLFEETIPAGCAFSVVVQEPFVVVGNEPPAIVKRRAGETVRWAVDRMKEEFSFEDPEEIYTIWLFKDRESYERYSREIFRLEPDTPFGYTSHRDRALVLNIATGGGTLLHEIMHSFVEANFPRCPPWLNEGLASLYEQSGERNGKIVGFVNWRLSGLRSAILRGSLPPLAWLTSRTERQFYDEDPGTNYSHARYLVLYLQERGALRRFYRELLENTRNDPTGVSTFLSALGESDPIDFEERWKRWVLQLVDPTGRAGRPRW